MEPKDRIIFALDVDSLSKTKHLVKRLAPHVGGFKVGLELITAVGAPNLIKSLHSLGCTLFYDGKYADIPETIGRATKVLAKKKVAMFDIHASAGKKSIEAAVINKGRSKVLGVTILTSINEDECISIFGDRPGPKVLKFATMLNEIGADGIVCSPQELKFLKDRDFTRPLTDMLFITPGIRPAWAPADDQKRIMTPAEAIRSGADYLVIGRPIGKPPAEIGSPVDAAKRIAEEIALAL